MKTLTAPIQQKRQFQTENKLQFIPHVSVSIREVVALLSAVISTVAIILLSVWISGMEATAILNASTWGIGFIFLAMAVDNREPTAFFQLFTGLALMGMAWLQNTVSPEFVILSGVLVAAWVSMGLFQRLR
jgi:hypothetical protein